MSVGLTIGTIREALADQIDNYLERDSNVYARPVGDVQYPAITVDFPDGEYVDYQETMTGYGVSAVRFIIVVETAGMDREAASIAIDDYTSAGQGNTSSIFDAILSDVTLGGVVATTMVSSPTVDRFTQVAEFPVEIHTNKVGAED